MSGDELIVLLTSMFFTGVMAKRCLPGWIGSQQRFARNTPLLAWVVAVALASFGFLFWLLGNWAAADVVDAPIYRMFYFVLGVEWTLLTVSLLPWFGLSFRDDILERQNPAAGIAVSGALAAAVIIYALANTGDGPGWWCVMIAAAMGQVTLFGGWAVVLALTRLYDEVTIDRDVGAGLRAGAWFLASGLVLGRAAAGTWTSFGATVAEFLAVAVYFPLLVLSGLATGRMFRRSNDPSVDYFPLLTGVLGGTIHLGVAAFILWRVGFW